MRVNNLPGGNLLETQISVLFSSRSMHWLFLFLWLSHLLDERDLREVNFKVLHTRFLSNQRSQAGLLGLGIVLEFFLIKSILMRWFHSYLVKVSSGCV